MTRQPSLTKKFVLGALLIALAIQAPAAAQFGKNKVRYQDFEWKVYHSPHFDVYYYPEAEHLLQKVVSFAESAYDQLSQEFDFKIQESTALIYYETHNAFEQNNIIQNFIPEGTGAFATPVRNRMVMPVDLPDNELMQLILHELTHIFEYHILFGANLGKGVAARPPLWFMEGLASYMAKDETARDKMYLRDAVVNDRLPMVTQDFGGYFAYRFGHAVFDFIEERWGKEGIRDFMIEIRNTLGGRVGRAIERTFAIDPEDFNSEFRRWLRKKYLPELVETGEPADFGRPYRTGGPGTSSAETSPVASPSGDLLAAFSTKEGQIDVMLFDNNTRRELRNLTKGYDKDFQYLVAQELTLGRKMGRDIAFSPDGNEIALFARKENGRVLVLIDVLKGKLRGVLPIEPDQPLGPAWSPDGSKIAFAGHLGGQFDIFTYELATGTLGRLTDDDIYDGAPTYSPDGKSIVLTSEVGGYQKLFRIDLENPGERFPIATGGLANSNETDAIYSADGSRLYFTSDNTGANNIFSLDLGTGEVQQHTNSVTGCFMPTVLTSPTGEERLVYTAYWKGRFDLYQQDLSDPITEPIVITEQQAPESEALPVDEIARFEPSIEVSIDDSNKEKYGGFDFFLEDVGGTIGVSDDQTFIAQAVLRFSDFLGDKRILAAFQSIESFQNFDVVYIDQSNRLNWQVHLFDDRDFFVVRDVTGRIRRDSSAISQTGAIASVVYPFNTFHRAELGAGYMLRELDFVSSAQVEIENASDDLLRTLFEQAFIDAGLVPPPLTDAEIRQTFIDANPSGVVFVPVITPRDDDFPIVQGKITGDTAIFGAYGPVTGRRWYLSGNYAPDTAESGTLTANATLEYRQYIPITKRMQLAYRFFGSSTDGNFATPIYFGGLDTVRGFEFRSLVGDQAFFQNIELRFPLIDFIATPVFTFQGVRGIFFLDIAGAWFDEFEGFRFYNSDTSSLQDAVASYGYGITFRMLGLDFNFDFAKRWDFESSSDGYETSFWIGRRF